MMRFEEYKRIIDQVKNKVIGIALWNYGEPFLNKELLQMIKYTVKAGIHVTVSTNGEFFNSFDFCKQVVQSGLHSLIICLDGANQETLSKYRVGSDFNTIIEGIRLLLKAREILGSKTPEVELQFIVMKHNEHQRNRMKHLARELGVDIYTEKTVGLDPNDPDFQSMAKELLPRDLSFSRFCILEDGSFGIKGQVPNHCSWVYHTTVINSDGTVVPCCYDLYSKYVMGNVFEESLEIIWKSDKYQNFRKIVNTDRKSIPMCNVCPIDRMPLKEKHLLSHYLPIFRNRW